MRSLLRYYGWFTVLMVWPTISFHLSVDARLAMFLGERFDPVERLLQMWPPAKWLSESEIETLAMCASESLAL
jgi:hypothetical protein